MNSGRVVDDGECIVTHLTGTSRMIACRCAPSQIGEDVRIRPDAEAGASSTPRKAFIADWLSTSRVSLMDATAISRPSSASKQFG